MQPSVDPVRRSRRDRRGRGVRGPLAPPGSPAEVSRGDRFGDLVVAAVDRGGDDHGVDGRSQLDRGRDGDPAACALPRQDELPISLASELLRSLNKREGN